MDVYDLLGIVEFGTQLEIVNIDTGKVLKQRHVLPWYANVELLYADVLLCQVKRITVDNGALRIEIGEEDA